MARRRFFFFFFFFFLFACSKGVGAASGRNLKFRGQMRSAFLSLGWICSRLLCRSVGNTKATKTWEHRPAEDGPGNPSARGPRGAGYFASFSPTLFGVGAGNQKGNRAFCQKSFTLNKQGSRTRFPGQTRTALPTARTCGSPRHVASGFDMKLCVHSFASMSRANF